MIEDVLNAYRKLGRQPMKDGAGWKVCCVVHDDQRPSVHIETEADGKVLMTCRSGKCEFKDMVAVLGLEQSDFFPSNGKTGNHKAKSSPKRSLKAKGPYKGPYKSPEGAIDYFVKQFGPPSAHWIYPDVDRSELMRVYRWNLGKGKKEYRPVYPDADGWYPVDPPGKLPLYNLPELATAQTVFVTEGEKCADLVKNLGLCGTTSAHGVTNAAMSDWSLLAGKEVVILPDHENGERYAADVGNILAAFSPAPLIRVLRLPLSGKGDDIQQWLESLPDSWTSAECRAKLEELACKAEQWKPAEREESGLPLIIIGSNSPNEGFKTWTPQALEALAKSNENEPAVFQRGGILIRVIRPDRESPPMIDPLVLDSLRGLMDRSACFGITSQTKNGQVTRWGPPPSEVVRDILALGSYDPNAFPPIDSVVESPRFLPDGRLILQPGYSREAQLYYAPSHELADLVVPERPTLRDVNSAPSS